MNDTTHEEGELEASASPAPHEPIHTIVEYGPPRAHSFVSSLLDAIEPETRKCLRVVLIFVAAIIFFIGVIYERYVLPLYPSVANQTC